MNIIISPGSEPTMIAARRGNKSRVEAEERSVRESQLKPTFSQHSVNIQSSPPPPPQIHNMNIIMSP